MTVSYKGYIIRPGSPGCWVITQRGRIIGTGTSLDDCKATVERLDRLEGWDEP